MLVTIKSAKGRHAFVGESKLSEKIWSSWPISAAIVKQIKNGDIIEASQKQIEAAVDKELLPAEVAEQSPVSQGEKPLRK